MGRPALPDALKQAQGTYDKRYAEGVRAERRLGTIVPFPALQEIPPCRLPLNAAGQQVYDGLTRILHDQGRLTVLTHMEVEALAAAFATAHAKMSAGSFVPMNAFQAILARIDKLERANVDQAYRGSQTPRQSNKFARSGFASRKA